jgi:hypothetical protein
MEVNVMTIPTPDQQTAQESARFEGDVGRFSDGLDVLPQTPDKLHRGRFSEGLEALPDTPRKRHRGRFSDGLDRVPETPAKTRRGNFADGLSHPEG